MIDRRAPNQFLGQQMTSSGGGGDAANKTEDRSGFPQSWLRFNWNIISSLKMTKVENVLVK